MQLHDIKELHNIAHINNLSSILERGILSHESAKRIPHLSVAAQEIQDRRIRVRVPGGLKLHEYANLYFCARNPMLYRCVYEHGHDNLGVLRISLDVLNEPNVVITDSNASSDYARFLPSPEGLVLVNKEQVFAEYWKHGNPIREWEHKSIKCAEVLVPRSVDPAYIMGIYVASKEAKHKIELLGVSLTVSVDPYMFFIRK